MGRQRERKREKKREKQGERDVRERAKSEEWECGCVPVQIDSDDAIGHCLVHRQQRITASIFIVSSIHPPQTVGVCVLCFLPSLLS